MVHTRSNRGGGGSLARRGGGGLRLLRALFAAALCLVVRPHGAAAFSFRNRKARLPNVEGDLATFTSPRPPPPQPPLAVQQQDARAYFAWAKRDQYKYSTVPIKVEPSYGTDYVNSGWTMFYSNMPVTWVITPVGGSASATVDVLEQTETHLQLGAGPRAGVWRITASATTCLDTCLPVSCPADSCTAQMGSPVCAAVAAGLSAHPGKHCDMAYFVTHYRILSPWQIGVGAAMFLVGIALAWYCILGCDCLSTTGLPGWWVFSDSTSWTVKAKAVEPPGLAPSVYQPRPAQQRLRLDIDATGAAKDTVVVPAPRMFRSAREQEKVMQL